MEFPFSQIQWIWIGLGQLLRRDPSFRRRRDGVGRDDFFWDMDDVLMIFNVTTIFLF